MTITTKQAPIKEYDPESKPAQYMLEETADLSAREGADYSGAVEKTDPAEIRLVKKLDWRIMPTLWVMYFLNYVSFN